MDALQAVVGNNGAYIMAVLALISLFGSTVGWIVVSSEVPYRAAKDGLFPTFFAKTNKNGSPVRSLSITNLMTQPFLFSTISGTQWKLEMNHQGPEAIGYLDAIGLDMSLRDISHVE